MSRDDICDALLRMQHSFRNVSRRKIGYAYKSEALVSLTSHDAVGVRG